MLARIKIHSCTTVTIFLGGAIVKRTSWLYLFTALMILTVVAFVGCGKSGEKPQTEAQTEEAPAETTESPMAYLANAEKLYTCEHHPMLVTDDAEAKCMQCEMAVTEMGEEAVAKVRAMDHKACEPCKVLFPADAEFAKCPGCEGDLTMVHGTAHEGHDHAEGDADHSHEG